MCRLPIDIMRRIIELVRQPLPLPGDPDVTWKDLNQGALVSLMRASRMTYFIAAPLLYKEVVVNNLSSFFLGIDGRVRGHHSIHPFLVYPPDHGHICQWIKKGNGSFYSCPRHTPASDLQKSAGEEASLASLPPGARSSIGNYHKLELLRMVKTVHFVYGEQDRTIFDTVKIDDYIDGDDAGLRIMNNVEVRRYTDLPPAPRLVPHTRNALPNLANLTIATWQDDRWGANNLIVSRRDHWKHTEASKAFDLFEKELGDLLPRFVAATICRRPCRGILSKYPQHQYIPKTNELHDANLSAYGHHLIPGTRNIIHVEQRSESETPLAHFTDHMGLIASELFLMLKQWSQKSSHTQFKLLRKTSFTFVLHREWGYSWSELSDREFDDEQKHLEELLWDFQVLVDVYEDGSVDDWIDKCDFIWEELHPGCRACGTDLLDVEHTEEEVDDDDCSDLSSEWSSS